jgi:hypothetical protein
VRNILLRASCRSVAKRAPHHSLIRRKPEIYVTAHQAYLQGKPVRNRQAALKNFIIFSSQGKDVQKKYTLDANCPLPARLQTFKKSQSRRFVALTSSQTSRQWL